MGHWHGGGVSPNCSRALQNLFVMIKVFGDRLGKQGHVYQHAHAANTCPCPRPLRVDNLSVSRWPDRKLLYWSPQRFYSVAFSLQEPQQQYCQRYCRGNYTQIGLCMRLFVFGQKGMFGNWDIRWCWAIFPQTLVRHMGNRFCTYSVSLEVKMGKRTHGLLSCLREIHSSTKSNTYKTKADTLFLPFPFCIFSCNLQESPWVRLCLKQRGLTRVCQSSLSVLSPRALFNTGKCHKIHTQTQLLCSVPSHNCVPH